MKPRIITIKILIIVLAMIVWMGCGQQQRTPKPAVPALQTSLERLKEANRLLYNLQSTHPNEDRQTIEDDTLGLLPSASTIPSSDFHISPETVFCQGLHELIIPMATLFNCKFCSYVTFFR